MKTMGSPLGCYFRALGYEQEFTHHVEPKTLRREYNHHSPHSGERSSCNSFDMKNEKHGAATIATI